MKSINYTTNFSVKRKLLGITGALLVLVIPIFIMQYAAHIEQEQSLCPFKMLTGFPCPGCGITKSLVFFYKAEFLKSIQYHLFGPVVILFCMATIIVLLAEIINRKEYFTGLLYNNKLGYSLGTILAVYHIVRLVYFVHTHSFADILRESVWM